MKKSDFDVLIVGAGPGGYVAAIRAAQLGLRTACVDPRETLGGTCLNVGCIPSKAMLHASEIYENIASNRIGALGIGVKGSYLDLEKMHASRREAVEGLTKGIASLFKKNGVEWLKGFAKFTGPNSVDVAGIDYTAQHIVIATGSTVTKLPELEIDNERVLDSTGALELSRVPNHLVVIGGGAIGLELGSVWRRLGAQVTVVEYLDQILPGMDSDVRKEATKLFAAQGIVLKTSRKVAAARKTKGRVILSLESTDGSEKEELSSDFVLVAIGRSPNTAGLELERIGLVTNASGQIEVDHMFRTSVDGVYAIGDVTPGHMLAHKAEDEGIAVAEIIAGHPGIVNHDVIPSVVYTRPEIASVGLTEEQAMARGSVKLGKFPMLANSRARTNHEPEGFVKIVSDSNTGEVLGVHIIAAVAGTMIAQAVQSIEFSATAEDIAYSCHAHPTHSEAIKEAALAVISQPIHI